MSGRNPYSRKPRTQVFETPLYGDESWRNDAKTKSAP